jgi:hypothetical protein
MNLNTISLLGKQGQKKSEVDRLDNAQGEIQKKNLQKGTLAFNRE